MKKVVGFILSLLIIGGITFGVYYFYIREEKDNIPVNIRGNCIVTECIKQLSPENTIEEMNEIIGFEAEENEGTYYWELSLDSGIEVTTKDKVTIKAVVAREFIANKKVNFEQYETLEEQIQNGVRYDDFITYVGNVDGILIEKTLLSNRYLWVAEDGSYLKASFSASSNRCTVAAGKIK